VGEDSGAGVAGCVASGDGVAAGTRVAVGNGVAVAVAVGVGTIGWSGSESPHASNKRGAPRAIKRGHSFIIVID
jgi:hypothetical protein